MNLYYDPILGLQYSFDDNAGKILIMDMASIPINFDVGNFKERFMYYMNKNQPLLISSRKSFDVDVKPIEVSPVIESNAWFSLKEYPRFSDIWTRPFMYGTANKMDLKAQDEFRKMFEDV